MHSFLKITNYIHMLEQSLSAEEKEAFCKGTLHNRRKWYSQLDIRIRNDLRSGERGLYLSFVRLGVTRPEDISRFLIRYLYAYLRNKK